MSDDFGPDGSEYDVSTFPERDSMSDYYAECECGKEIRVNMYGMGHCMDCGTDRNPMATPATPITKAPSFDPATLVLDGAADVDELPDLGFSEDIFAPPATASFISEGDGYPDWTDDRLYRLVDECELFIEAYNARGQGRYAEARQQMRVIFDLVNEDGR